MLVGVRVDDTSGAPRWGADAQAYDSWFDQPWGAYASAVEFGLVLAQVEVSGQRVCDAGCGTGRLTSRLESAGATVVGVDRDPAALAVAGSRVRGPLVRADVQALPFPSGCFDLTVAVTVCEFTADPGQVIVELVRVTRPGGAVVIGSLNRHSPWGWWNRRQFSAPPWVGATFLSQTRLEGIGGRYGETRWRAGLFVPRALPGMHHWAPVLDTLGRRVAPRWAAFGVLTIQVPTPDQ